MKIVTGPENNIDKTLGKTNINKFMTQCTKEKDLNKASLSIYLFPPLFSEIINQSGSHKVGVGVFKLYQTINFIKQGGGIKTLSNYQLH